MFSTLISVLLMSLISVQYHRNHSSLLPLILCKFLLQQRSQIGSYYPLSLYYPLLHFSIPVHMFRNIRLLKQYPPYLQYSALVKSIYLQSYMFLISKVTSFRTSPLSPLTEVDHTFVNRMTYSCLSPHCFLGSLYFLFLFFFFFLLNLLTLKVL